MPVSAAAYLMEAARLGWALAAWGVAQYLARGRLGPRSRAALALAPPAWAALIAWPVILGAPLIALGVPAALAVATSALGRGGSGGGLLMAWEAAAAGLGALPLSIAPAGVPVHGALLVLGLGAPGFARGDAPLGFMLGSLLAVAFWAAAGAAGLAAPVCVG